MARRNFDNYRVNSNIHAYKEKERTAINSYFIDDKLKLLWIESQISHQ